MPSLCSFNLTLGIYQRTTSEFIDIKGKNKVTGVMGVIYDKFLVHRNQR